MKNNILTIILIFVLFVLTTQVVSATVVINEIMYDPINTNTNHQWVEIYNNNLDENLTAWSFYEADTNHGLTVQQGSFILPGKEYAIIAQDGAQFLLDYPTFTGTVLDSSFSLNLGGELIGLKDNLGNTVDSDVTYSGSWNLNGEGYSLEKIDPTINDNTFANWRSSATLGGTPGALNNNNPTLTINDFSIDEDVGITHYDLYDYADDAEDFDSNLIFNLDSESDVSAVDCRINALDGHTLDCNTLQDQSGSNTLQITVFDTNGGFATDSFTITVNPVDDPAVWNTLNDQNVDEDSADGTAVYPNIVSQCNDVDNPEVITITSTNPNYDLAINGTDLIIGNLEDNYNDNGNLITLDCNSITASFTLTINSINDAPVTTTIPNQEAVEGVEFTIDVTATDVDNALADLEINEDLSTVNGIPFSSLSWIEAEDLTITGTPNVDGLVNVNVVVTDHEVSNSNSLPASFILDIAPALEILADQVQISFNGKTYHANETINVSPGDEITVNFPFKNNFNKQLGHINTEADVNVPGFTDFPYAGICQGTDCDDGRWVLTSGEESSDSFTFTVPQTISSNDFVLNLGVTYDQFWGLLIFFQNSLNVNFHVDRDNIDIEIVDEHVFDENLTCVRTAQLGLEIANTGVETITPEVLIYDQKAIESSLDKVTGEFTQFVATPNLFVEQTLSPIASGNTAISSIAIDTINLTKGEHTLYIYVVNPYFAEADYFIGDKAEVKINIDDCLNTSALEEFFTLAKNSPTGKSADLLDFVNEDKLSNYNLIFNVLDQSNQALVDCSTSGSQLTCAAPLLGEHGTNDLTIEIDEASTLTAIEESFTVTVAPVMEINNVKINNVNVAEGGSVTAKPAEALQVTFTLTNYLDYPITGINANIASTGNVIDLETESAINLDAGREQQITLTGEIPYNLAEGNYNLVISAQGQDYENNLMVQSDAFNFILSITQDPAKVLISKLTLEDENGITCKASTSLSVELTNTGSNDENDVIITAQGNNFELNSNTLRINHNEQLTYVFEIPAENLSLGNNNIEIKVSYRNNFESDQESTSIRKDNCLEFYSPTENNLIIQDGETINFALTLAEAGYDNSITWFVNNVAVRSGSPNYQFSATDSGDYQIKAVINANEEETHTWNVEVTNIPLSNNYVVNVPEDVSETQLASFPSLTIENNYAKIVFDENVDLRNIFDLDSLIIIENGMISIDSRTAPELNKPATITLKKSFTNPVILKADGFATNLGFAMCGTSCQQISNGNGIFTFRVDGFSTYEVVEEQPASLEVSEIVFNELERNQTDEITVTIKNTGSFEDLTNLYAELINPDSDYNLEIVGTLPNTLGAQQETTLNLKVTIPEEADGGEQDIGTLRISARDYSNNIVQTSKTITINPKSYLTIKKIDINGKSSGDLSIEEINEIEVEVGNEYDEDMDNVIVTVNILDVDGDDLEEEADDNDIRSGKDETFKVEYDLINEKLDEESYTLEIVVEGEADDGTEHKTTFTKIVDVDREKHKVIFKRLSLGSNEITCIKETNLRLDVENIGKSDEDDVEVRVYNSALGIDLKKTDLSIDKYSDRNNEESLTFNLDLENAKAGTYPLIVELYLDGKKKDDQTVNIKVNECYTSNTVTQTQTGYANDNIADQLQAQLLSRQQAQKQTVVKKSLRDSDIYTLLLGTLVVMLFLAVILALAVMMAKPKRRKKN